MVSSGEDQLLLFVTENVGFFFFLKRIFSELIFVNLLGWIISCYVTLSVLICLAPL